MPFTPILATRVRSTVLMRATAPCNSVSRPINQQNPAHAIAVGTRQLVANTTASSTGGPPRATSSITTNPTTKPRNPPRMALSSARAFAVMKQAVSVTSRLRHVL